MFFRHIGLDPDVVRTPIEAAVLERMMRGGFLSGGLLDDVLLIALLDTGVPVWALDADSVDGPLGIRASREGERLGRWRGRACAARGTAGRRRRRRAAGGAVRRDRARRTRPARTRRGWRCSPCRSPACPTLYAEEALWSCRAALETP